MVKPSIETRNHAYDVVQVLSQQLLQVNADDQSGRTKEAENAAVVLLADTLARFDHARAETVIYRIHDQLIDAKIRPIKQLTRQELHDNLYNLDICQLIEGYIVPQNNLSAHTKYKLARFFTSLAEIAYKSELREPCLAEAATWLRTVDNSMLQRQVEIDPGFALLREGYSSFNNKEKQIRTS